MLARRTKITRIRGVRDCSASSYLREMINLAPRGIGRGLHDDGDMIKHGRRVLRWAPSRPRISRRVLEIMQITAGWSWSAQSRTKREMGNEEIRP